MPETFNTDKVGGGHMGDLGWFILHALSRDNAKFDEFLAKVKDSKGQFEVTLTMGGVEISFKDAVRCLIDQFDEQVQQAAVKIVMDNAEDLRKPIDGMGETLRAVESELKARCRKMFPGIRIDGDDY